MNRTKVWWMVVCAFVLVGFAERSASAQAVTYTYDTSGRVTKASYGAAGTVNYTYDSAGRLISRSAPEPAPVLAIAKTHSGSFLQGQNGAAYSVLVSNAGVAPTNGTVTVAESAPSGLTLASMTGAGWSCNANICTRSDALAGGNSYPAIAVTVNVAANATSPQVNAVSVAGGGSTPTNPSDSTVIMTAPPQPPAAVTVFSPSQGAAGVSPTTPLTWGASSGATSYDVYFGASAAPPLAVNTVSTTYSPTLSPSTTYYWMITAKNAAGSTPSAVWSFTTAAAPSGLRFIPVTPCRIMDTRTAPGAFGGPSLAGGSTRNVSIPQSACNIPGTAQAYSLNVTVVPPGPLTYLSIWPAGDAQPVVSTLNSFDGRVVANAAIVPAGASGAISLFASNTTDAIVDIDGYFAPASIAGSLSFYAATPCRVADTRNANGPFGGPFLSGGSTRNFAIPSSACGVPAAAQAYSLNITVVPHGPLSYLTTWPAGQPQPVVSTLNSFNGAVVANAAIVPAGSAPSAPGAVSVFVTDDTDVIIDINGYFAPPGSAGALSLYTLTPCRVADTRTAAGPFGGPSLAANASRSFAIPSSACSVPATAQAYSLNVTVAPPGPLTYLTAWPSGQTQPVVSTLNSLNGAVVANAAIVPAGASGGVSIFVSNATDVILDINAYFAQ